MAESNMLKINQDFVDSEPRPECPEHEKLKAIAVQSQAIGEFIEYGGYVLAERVHRTREGIDSEVITDKTEAGCEDDPRWCDRNHIDELWPHRESLQKILARFFGIDQEKLAQEKDAMLEVLRAAPVAKSLNISKES